MVIGQIIQNFRNTSQTYQFYNWIIRTNDGVFISNDPKQETFNYFYSVDKSFSYVSDYLNTWYDSEIIVAE